MRARRNHETPVSSLSPNGSSRYFFLGRVNAAPFVFDRVAKLTVANLHWLKYGHFDENLYFRSLQAPGDDGHQNGEPRSGCSAHQKRGLKSRPLEPSSPCVAASKRRKFIDLTLESDEEADIVSLPTPPPSSPLRPSKPQAGREQFRKKGAGQMRHGAKAGESSQPSFSPSRG